MKILLLLSVIVGVFALISGLVSPATTSSWGARAWAAGFAVLLSPFFAWLWTHLGRGGRDLQPPTKIAFGMLMTAAGLSLVTTTDAANDASTISAAILAGALLLAMGELCIEPVALSAVTRLAPVRYIALSIAGWWLITSMPGHVSDSIRAWFDAAVHGGAGALIAGSLLPAAILLVAGRWIKTRTHIQKLQGSGRV